MTHDPTNDLDELVRAAARDYNAPGATPREAIWARIHARREATRQVVVPVRAFGARRRDWIYAALGAAAILVIGIGIGRSLTTRDAGPQTQPTIATAPSANPSAQPDSSPGDSAVLPAPDASPPQRLSSAPSPSAGAGPTLSPQRPRGARETAEPSTPSGSSAAYRLAILEHLTGTEAMLTTFRTAARRGDVDAEITRWARSLLTTTRLLESSAGQDDPTMKRLLGDLELVLVQITQYTTAGTHRAEELELIEHSIERRGVIGKIRTTIPARLAPAGT